MLSGGVLSVFRFFQFIPYGVLALYGNLTYQDVRTHPAALKAPYSPYIAPGQGLAAIIGSLGVAWNLFTCVLAHCWIGERRRLIFSAAIDILLASGLLIAFVLQSTYMPRPLGSCHNASDWTPVGTNRSIFTVVAMQNSTYQPNSTEIIEECKGFVTVWACEIPMFIMSFFAVWIALRAAHVVPDIGAIVLQHTVPPIRFAHGYRIKYQRHRRAMASKRISKSANASNGGWASRNTKEKQGLADTNMVELTPVVRAPMDTGLTTLDQILSYPVISSIAESSHFQDMQHLMLTSKSVCNGLLGSLGSRSTALRRKTCEDGQKTECWCCRCQICVFCKRTLSVNDPTSDHTPRCQIYCSKCYYTSNCHFKRPRFGIGNWEASRYCSQHSRTANADFTDLRDVCEDCYRLPYDDIVQKRTRREKALMVHRAELTLHCTGCKATLSKNGPRWWNCNVCQKECNSDIHPAWAGDGNIT